jgi:ribonuclease HI
MLHLFCDCPKASAIWTAIGGPITMRKTFELDWNAWIAANILQRNCIFLEHNWSQIFIFTCWFIWKWRNKYEFDANFKGHNNVVSSIMQYILEWNNATAKTNCQSDTNVTPLHWVKPDFGFFKLNVDGTRSLSGMIGAGGVIRDYNGNWCHGFMRNIGKGEVLQAEAWGLFTGLQIAKELKITHLMVESDSAVLISLIHSSQLQLHPLGTLLMNCKSIMNNFNHCSVSHIHRERNMVADCLAKKSIDHEFGLCRLTTMPVFVRSSVLDDLGGLVRLRSLRVASATY